MSKGVLSSKKMHLPVVIITGIFVGLLAFLFNISNASSYLSDDPKTCVNCHIMAPQYATWKHSSHREWANCNDCHVPQDNIVKKYFFKAKDGLRHATVFTQRAEPQVIYIKEEGATVVHENCIRCHEQQITDAKLSSKVSSNVKHTQNRKCWECHREVPHGRVNSLSSTPDARVPLPSSIVPDWLKDYLND